MPWHQFLSGEGLLGSALCEEKAVWPKGSREPKERENSFSRQLTPAFLSEVGAAQRFPWGVPSRKDYVTYTTKLRDRFSKHELSGHTTFEL